LASSLKEAGATVGDQVAKAFRALNLVPGDRSPDKRPDSDLGRLSASIADQLKLIVTHDPGTRLGSDPEDLHQHRVGVRRLRSLLWAAKGLLEPEWANGLRSELEWLGDQLNPVRDLDVMIPYLRADLDQLPSDEAAELEPFLKQLDQEREAARAAMLTALESDRYLQLLNALEDATRSLRVRPPDSTLRDAAVKAFRRLRRAADAMQEPFEDEAMHLVRRLAKKARYSAEAVGGGKKIAKFLSAIKALQDVLGDHQDAAVAEGRIRRYAAEVEGTRAAFALGRLTERQSFKKLARRKEFPAAWRAVERAGRKAWL
jgi:CHAD domain-containing protein